MNKISDAVDEIVNGNTFLQTGLRHKLLNLSQVARFLRPQIEARTKKSVRASAILMHLSRMSRQGAVTRAPEPITIENINVQTELAALSFAKSRKTTEEINRFYNIVQEENGYITITRGTNQINVIFDRKKLPVAERDISAKPLYSNKHVAALGISFAEKHLYAPGLFYYIYQQLYFQNINVVEQASTATELILYLDQNDLRLAFATLYNHFIAKQQELTGT